MRTLNWNNCYYCITVNKVIDMFLNLTGKKSCLYFSFSGWKLGFLKAIMEGLGYCKPEIEPERKFNIYECREINSWKFKCDPSFASLLAFVQIKLSEILPSENYFHYILKSTSIYCLVRLHAFVCVIKVSVPVSEVVGVEEGRVEILPKKSVEDTDKDFTGGGLFSRCELLKKSKLHSVFVQLEGLLILYYLFEMKRACEQLKQG